MRKKQNIKNCPFCGRSAILLINKATYIDNSDNPDMFIDVQYFARVRCFSSFECGASMQHFGDSQKSAVDFAVKAWNNRASKKQE